ncbi:MAG: nuclear transport factor 2 family protein [Pyrinomonadaceae bacterium]
MTKAEFKKLLDSLADAWGRRDYAAAAEAFAEDVRYADPLRYSFDGRARLREFFEADEGYAQRTVWHTVVFDEEQQAGAAEYTYDGTHRYHGTALVRVGGGEITHWREYQHVDPRGWEEFASETAF